MRPGQDRHELAEQIVDVVFPDGVALIAGLRVGDDASTVATALPEATSRDGGWSWSPEGYGEDDARSLVISVQTQAGRVAAVSAFFRSANKIDVDAPYAPLRKALDKAYGKPDRERGGTLVFVWSVPGGDYPSRTRITRYKASDGVNTLEVSTRAADGVRFSGPLGKGQKGPPPKA